MAERDDELEALRRLDPVDATELPAANSTAATELFERITATDPGAPSRAVGFVHRRRWLATAVVAAAAVVVVVGAALALAGDDEPDGQVAPSSTSSVGGGTPSPGAVSCMESYSLAALEARDVAFDGVVESVDGDVITFTVNEWFRGGEGERTTRKGAIVLGGGDFTPGGGGASVELEAGTRLLVAGDDDFAWACGFTQPFDPAVAADWERALAG